MNQLKKIVIPILLFVCFQIGYGQKTSIFPADAWGVYGWTQFTGFDKNTAPLAKGGPIIMRWIDVEPQNGKYAFDVELLPKLQKALANNFYVFLKIYLCAPSGAGFTPEWIYANGVPKVSAGGNFPYYFDPEYKVFYYRLIAEFGKYVQALPDNLKSRILFIQSTEGTTGDGGYYKADPTGTEYDITRDEWSLFRLEAWKRFKTAFSKNGVLQFPILTNNDSNTGGLRDWMLSQLPGAIGVKNGMFTHGYQISDAQERLKEHLALKKETEAAGKVFFARGEMDAEMHEKGWITQNKKQGIYWSAIYATHCAISMWNFPQGDIIGPTYADGLNFFNKYAGEINPGPAKGAFCAFYRGLDASDTQAYSVVTHGAATKGNQTRYTSICNAFKAFGAGMADPAAATGGGMTNRDAIGYNDAGWQILTTNFQRYITQLEPETTSNAYWQVDASVYGRFARGFAKDNAAKSKMYFDLDDKFFPNGPLNGSQAIEVAITYRDSDAGSWELMYDSKTGMKSAMAVTNSGAGTNVWKTQRITLKDAYLGNRGDKGADFILVNKANTACRFHMIAVDKTVATSLVKTAKYDGISIYNNMNDQLISIVSQNAISKMEIYDMLGKSVRIIIGDGNFYDLNTNDMEKGLYILSVLDKNGNLKREKIFIQ